MSIIRFVGGKPANNRGQVTQQKAVIHRFMGGAFRRQLSQLKEAWSTQKIPALCIEVSDVSVQLAPIVEILAERVHPETRYLRLAKYKLQANKEHHKGDGLLGGSVRSLWRALPNLKKLELEGYFLLQELDCGTLEELTLVENPVYNLDKGKLPNLRSLCWQAGLDVYGVTPFEGSQALDWALDIKRTPKLTELDLLGCPDFIGNYLFSASKRSSRAPVLSVVRVPSVDGVTVSTSRLRVKRLEVKGLDNSDSLDLGAPEVYQIRPDGRCDPLKSKDKRKKVSIPSSLRGSRVLYFNFEDFPEFASLVKVSKRAIEQGALRGLYGWTPFAKLIRLLPFSESDSDNYGRQRGEISRAVSKMVSADHPTGLSNFVLSDALGAEHWLREHGFELVSIKDLLSQLRIAILVNEDGTPASSVWHLTKHNREDPCSNVVVLHQRGKQWFLGGTPTTDLYGFQTSQGDIPFDSNWSQGLQTVVVKKSSPAAKKKLKELKASFQRLLKMDERNIDIDAQSSREFRQAVRGLIKNFPVHTLGSLALRFQANQFDYGQAGNDGYIQALDLLKRVIR